MEPTRHNITDELNLTPTARNRRSDLKFVDESTVKNKDQYAGILRAQLSSCELALLFYNALHPVGDKLKPHVERYAMLDNLDLQLT